jgi:O-antigen ligase
VLKAHIQSILSKRNQLAGLILLATVAAAPLPFGSASASAISFWCATLGVALLAVKVTAPSKGQMALFLTTVLIMIAYGIVLHEQLSQNPWLSIAKPDPIWSRASETLGGDQVVPVAAIAHSQPWLALGPPLCAVLALLCGFLLSTDPRFARLLFVVVAWSGVAYAIFGFASLFLDPMHILWRDKQAYLGSLTSTFINRNTAAVYFGSCAIIWLVTFLENLRHHLRHQSQRWSDVIRRFSTAVPSMILLPFSMMLVCLAAMFMTGSRAGAVLSCGVLLVCVILYAFRRANDKKTLLKIVAAAVGFGFVLFHLMGGAITSRLQIEGPLDVARLATYRSTLRIIGDHPWLGTGLGTFGLAFPAYRGQSATMSGVWDRTHNTLLELAAEMGLPLAGLVTAAWVSIFIVLVWGIFSRRAGAFFPLAGFGVGVLAITHSLVDFSMQIAGYSIVAMAVVGAGLSQSLGSSVNADRLE